MPGTPLPSPTPAPAPEREPAPPEPEAMLRAAEVALASSWGGPVQLTLVERLEGSDRAVTLRASLVEGGGRAYPLESALNPRPPTAGRPATVVVKAHDRAKCADEPVCEPAGLEVLGELGSKIAPRLLAVADEPALLVMEDFGAGLTSLADLLLGRDPEAAAGGLLAWAAAMAELHIESAGAKERFASALGAHASRLGMVAPPPDEDMSWLLTSAATDLSDRLPELLGVTPSRAALDEVRSIADLLPAGAAGALSPADACPDNNALRPDGMVLFDFEGTAYRHLAWDAAYLVVPWPSCWCAWRLPEAAAVAALDRWREMAGPTLPRVATVEFEADLSAAVAGWTAITLGWYLPRAATGKDELDGPTAGERVEPAAQAMLVHRLRTVVDRPDPRLPALTELFEETLAAALAIWGDQELPLAPAFR